MFQLRILITHRYVVAYCTTVASYQTAHRHAISAFDLCSHDNLRTGKSTVPVQCVDRSSTRNQTYSASLLYEYRYNARHAYLESINPLRPITLHILYAKLFMSQFGHCAAQSNQTTQDEWEEGKQQLVRKLPGEEGNGGKKNPLNFSRS